MFLATTISTPLMLIDDHADDSDTNANIADNTVDFISSVGDVVNVYVDDNVVDVVHVYVDDNVVVVVLVYVDDNVVDVVLVYVDDNVDSKT